MKRLYSLLGLSLLFVFGAHAQSYPLEVEAYQVHSSTEGVASLDGMTTYRLYITNLGTTDFISSVYGNNEDPLEISVPEGVYNSSFNASWSASGISPVFVGLFPEMEYDSYATIGLSQSAATSGIPDAADPSIVEDPLEQITPMFIVDGSNGVSVSSITGVAYYILNGNPVGLPEVDGRVMIMQITTSGSISGMLNVQIFPNGIGEDFPTYTYLFEDTGLFAAVGSCLADTDGDGICDEDEVPGCTDMAACNYNVMATDDDGTCDFADADGDGICDSSEIAGCTDNQACNYEPSATDEDGSCGVLDACGVCLGDDSSCTGCSIDFACNYDATAVITDNTMCEYESCAGCMDMVACNYEPTATFDDGTNCLFAAEFLDCTGDCLNDTDGDGVCDELETVGCTDMVACNYDGTATDTDDTLCEYAEMNYDCDGVCLNDMDEDGVCDEFEVDGCTDMDACNYDALATDDDDTCVYAQEFYDCDGNCLMDTDEDGVCDDLEVDGCTDEMATNYNMDATEDDASCCYLVLSLTATDADCFGGEGMITATVAGSTETVTYTLGMESNETGEFMVPAGDYTVSAMDSNANMCSSAMDVTVGEGTEVTVEASATDETAGELGVGTATATGGSGEYTYVWYDSDGNEVDASALAAGDYSVTATDSNGCDGVANVSIIFNGIDNLDPLAFGLFPNPSSGAITLQVSTLMQDVNMQVLDATGRVVFTQDALVLQGATTFDFSNLSTGTYTIVIRNDNGTSVRRLSIQN